MKQYTRASFERKDGEENGHVRVIESCPTVQVPGIGLDTGDKYSQICLRDAAGAIASETRVRTTRDAVRKFFGTLVRCRVALEV